MDTLNWDDVELLAGIRNACRYNYHVKWQDDPELDLIREGVARDVSPTDDGVKRSEVPEDPRDWYVHITLSVTETWIKVSDVLAMMKSQQLFFRVSK